MYTDPDGMFWDYVLDAISIAWSLGEFIANPTWENFGWLALDIGLGILPFVPSIVRKAAGKVDDVHDAVVIGNGMSRVISKADDIGAAYYGGYKVLNAYNDMARLGDGIVTLSSKIIGRIDNAGWLMSKIMKGYKIVDIGKDSRNIFKWIISAHGMERRLLFYWWHGGHIITRGIRFS
jgi:hypothetical protein